MKCLRCFAECDDSFESPTENVCVSCYESDDEIELEKREEGKSKK